jgi:hypothetical protein
VPCDVRGWISTEKRIGKNEESEITDVLFRAFPETTKKNNTKSLTIIGDMA